jgi:cephalosporin hydroxylase
MTDITDEEIIRRFHGLYAGGSTEKLRAAGDVDAMPPWAQVTWLGKQVVKCPMDLWVYQEIVWETYPGLIIEAGTGSSGSAYFFATLLDFVGGSGRVITIDVMHYPDLRVCHDRIVYLTGDSTGEEVFKCLTNRFQPLPRTMVVLDSLHTYEHVKRELELYSPLVSTGCYLVVEDTGWRNPVDTPEGQWADTAVKEFLRGHPEFQVDTSREKHLLTSNSGGWLRRV